MRTRSRAATPAPPGALREDFARFEEAVEADPVVAARGPAEMLVNIPCGAWWPTATSSSRPRLLGCGHFRTDVSYLPDLEAYLADLLRNRERLAAAIDADE